MPELQTCEVHGESYFDGYGDCLLCKIDNLTKEVSDLKEKVAEEEDGLILMDNTAPIRAFAKEPEPPPELKEYCFDADYVGHGSVVVEAYSREEAIEKAKAYDFVEDWVIETSVGDIHLDSCEESV